jgi:thymidylate synthase (FAD)
MTAQVKLSSITQPIVEIDSKRLTPEEYVVYVARVSNPQNQSNLDTADKLLNYCIKKQHWSIFEQVDMTVEIQTSKAISAQILRHRSATFQEFSARYAKVESLEPVEFRLQDTKNRQNSFGFVGLVSPEELIIGEDANEEDRNYLERVKKHLQSGLALYQEGLELGYAKECVRFILPTTMSTRLYMKNNIRNWIHYLQVRALGEGVQKEHREIALEIQRVFKEQFPVISKALGWVE